MIVGCKGSTSKECQNFTYSVVVNPNNIIFLHVGQVLNLIEARGGYQATLVDPDLCVFFGAGSLELTFGVMNHI